jgi:hypothetical protein|tara:strand:- start:236 stop:499 length:264 start_codon:yes stop_codon:yes gene_type:complete
MFNDDITKAIADAARKVLANSSRNDSKLSPAMRDAAVNIQDQVNSAMTIDTQNSLIKDAMVNAADMNHISVSPEASREFEQIAKGKN